MRPVLAVVLLLALATGAEAKHGPAPAKRLTPSPAELAIFMGPAGAMLESDYFRAPGATLAGRGLFPCRLRLDLFAKTRLAETCR
jgi:hypothetical protein